MQNFKYYNREKELERREMERKEHDWEQELIKAMNASTIPAMWVTALLWPTLDLGFWCPFGTYQLHTSNKVTIYGQLIKGNSLTT